MALVRPRRGPRPEKDKVTSILNSYLNSSVDLTTRTHIKTRKRQERVWQNWEEFVENTGICSDQVWIDLCCGLQSAKDTCCAWIHSYAHFGTKERVCLGPAEYETVQCIQSATTLEDAWSALVQVANRTVMVEQRKKDPVNAGFWDLTFTSRKVCKNVHTSDVAKSISDIVERLGGAGTIVRLSPDYEKVPMTGRDILLGLEKLWTEGEHINASPTVRHAFHGALLLSGVGGWRPKSVTMVHYRDVQLYWVKHPKEPSRTVTVARVTIHHVKLHKNIVNRGSQKTSVKFIAVAAATQLVCLLRILVSKAFADNAFLRPFSSVDDVLWPRHELDHDGGYSKSWLQQS